MADIKESLHLVVQYLLNFYHDEPDDIAAAKHAVWANVDNRREVWRLSRAFIDLFSTPLPDETLQNIVVGVAKRDVWSDDEAMMFLRKIYEESCLNDVAGFDTDDNDTDEKEM